MRLSSTPLPRLTAALTSLVVISLGASAVWSQALLVDNRVLVRVNDRIVTQYQYQRQVAGAMAALTAADLEPDDLRQRREELPKQILRTLWDDLLVLSRADQLGLSVSEFELDETMLDQMKQFGMEDREQLELALAQNGMSLEQYRSNLESQMLQQRVFGTELFPRVQLEEDELRRVYRDRQDDYRVPETRALQELVVLESDAGSQLDEIAVRVAAAWSRGEDGEAVAEREGDTVRFIDLGTVERDQLAPALGEAAFGTVEGQVSEPVVARGGLHVVKTVTIVASRVPTFEEIRDQVEQDERRRRLETERELYLKELEESAYYETYLSSDLAGFRTTTGFSPGAGGLGGVSTSPLGIGIELDAEIEAVTVGESGS